MRKIKVSIVALVAFALTAGITYANTARTSIGGVPCWTNQSDVGNGNPDQNSSNCPGLDVPCCYTSTQTFNIDE